LSQSRIWRRAVRPRVLIYASVLMLIAALVLGGIALRPPFRLDVLRDRSALARIAEKGRVENVFRLQIMNSTESPSRYRLSVTGLEGAEIASEREFDVGPAQARWVVLRVQLPPQLASGLRPGPHPIRFVAERQGDGDGGTATVREKSTFVLPN
jgi:polyferredoxin